MSIKTAPWYSSLAPYVERDDLAVALKNPFTDATGAWVKSVPSVFLRLPRWKGPPFVDDFGKKAAAFVEIEGEHLFAELAVLRLLEKEGWEGRWVNTYSGRGEVWRYLTEWHDVARSNQMSRPIQHPPAAALLERIATNSGTRFTGCWDVFAWRDDKFVFLEAKRQSPKYKDTVKDSQESWVKTALSLGNPSLTSESFSFVQWDYREGR